MLIIWKNFGDAQAWIATPIWFSHQVIASDINQHKPSVHNTIYSWRIADWSFWKIFWASTGCLIPCEHRAIKFFLTEISQPTGNFWCTSPTNARNGSYRFVAYPSTVKNLIRDMILKTMVLFCFRFLGKNFIMPIMLPQARTPATAPFELMRKKIFIQIKFMVFVMQMVNYLENVALLLLLCIKISLINNLFSIIFILKIQKTVTRCTVF